MRYISALIVIALLVAPLCAAGQPISRPLPADGKCSVAPDESWRPQEKFVWSRVCIGEAADFNKTPDYGGDLDPRSSGELPDSRILRASFLETILLQPEYRNVLTRRGVRIVGARFTEVIDLENAELAQDLWLERSLLQKGANFSGARANRGLTIDASKVTGQLQMAKLQVGQDLIIKNTTQSGEVNLEDAQISGRLDLEGSKVTGKLKMESLTAGHLIMNENAEFVDIDLNVAHIRGVATLSNSKFAGSLSMIGCKIDGLLEAEKSQFSSADLQFSHIGSKLNFEGAKFARNLNMQGIAIAGHLAMNGGGQFASVILVAARIQGIASLWGSKFSGPLSMVGVRVEALMDASGSEFEDVDLEFAHIGGALKFGNSKIAKGLNMQGVQVAGDLAMNDGGQFSAVDLQVAHLQGVASLWGSKFSQPLNMLGLRVDGILDASGAEFYGIDLSFAHLGGTLILTRSKIAKWLNMRGMQIDGDLKMETGTIIESPDVILVFAHIGGSLDLGGTIAHQIDLTGAVVTSELHVGGRGGRLEWRCEDWAGADSQPPTSSPISWTLGDVRSENNRCGQQTRGSLPKLILRNAQVGVLQDSTDAWPPVLDLEGFKYDRLGGFGGEDAADMRQRLPEQWRDWLRRNERFSTQPYTQLASVLQAAGHRDTAEAVLYYSRSQERGEEKHWDRWLWLTLLQAIAGYGIGIYTFSVLYWVLLLTLLGAIILHWSAPNARRRGVIWCVGASFQQLLPIVVFSQEFKDFFENREPTKQGETRNLAGWQVAIFSVLALAGWILGFFLLAAMSGLAPKV